MRYLITGVRGFIGAAVARSALANGHEVVGVDQSPGGRTLPGPVRVVSGDITRPAEWRALFDGADVVVHSAAMHHTEQIAGDPYRSIEVNLRGTRLVLAMAAAAGVPRVVNLSSAKVYGEPLSFPSGEEDLPNPVEPYGLAKAVGEQYCKDFAARSALSCVSVRPFSVYGPGQDLSTGYIGQLVDGWLEDRPVTLSGGPQFLRDFVHVDDVVDLCLAAAAAQDPPDVVNAGSGRATSLAELVSLFAGLSGGDLEVRYTPARPGTIERTLADVGRCLPLLGREPVTLRAGLLETIRSFGTVGSSVA